MFYDPLGICFKLAVEDVSSPFPAPAATPATCCCASPLHLFIHKSLLVTDFYHSNRTTAGQLVFTYTTLWKKILKYVLWLHSARIHHFLGEREWIYLFNICGGLNGDSPHRFMCLNAWPLGNSNIGMWGLVGVGTILMEEV